MVRGVTTLVPAYGPGPELVRLVRALVSEGARVVVVDDGNPPGKRVSDLLDPVPEGVRILFHDVNRGKGVALKTGFRWILENVPETPAVVTADADGQHLVEDIRRVAEETLRHPDGLTLGVRALPATAPFRSRFGNAWARVTFRLLTGAVCSDTQTGLRGVPRALLPDVLAVPGDRYDYELRMLAAACCFPAPIHETPIATVYADGNRSSHFRTVRDGLGTQAALFGYCLGRRFRRGGHA